MIGSLFSWVVDKILGGGAIETLQKQLSDWKGYAVSVAQMVGFLTAAIPAFFVGLFLSVGGLDYFLLIDKSSMLASLFFYAAVLSCLTMIVSFIPRLIARKGPVLWAARGLAFLGFAVYIIGLEYAVFLALLAGGLLLWVLLRKELNQEPGPEPAPKWRGLSRLRHNLELLKVVSSVLLLCCFVFGYLRGEHLREQLPSMIINLTGAARTAKVTIIMSSNQGVLVFEDRNPEPRFYAWDRISSMASTPEQGGIRQRLRDWRNAVRGWMGGTAAVVRGWVG
jgi:hypothetical protein